MSRAQRLTMEETIRVSEWIKANDEFMKEHRWNLELVRKRIQSELAIRTTPVAIERIAGWEHPTSRPTPSTNQRTSFLLVVAVEHLYDQLGEERHPSLEAIRQMYATVEKPPAP